MLAGFPALVTVLALLVYVATGINVGRMRIRCGVRAPATSGPPEFERAFRIQQNTQEQIVVFVPALWLFALLVSSFWAGIIGLVWIAGRVLYAFAYQRAPEARRPGFVMAFASSLLLLLGALGGALFSLR